MKAITTIQIAIEPSKSTKGKFQDYFDSVWNKFDAAIYLIGVFTFILKNFELSFWVITIFLFLFQSKEMSQKL